MLLTVSKHLMKIRRRCGSIPQTFASNFGPRGWMYAGKRFPEKANKDNQRTIAGMYRFKNRPHIHSGFARPVNSIPLQMGGVGSKSKSKSPPKTKPKILYRQDE